MAMATMERDLLTLAQRKGVKKVDTRNDELHQANQSWTMARQKTQLKEISITTLAHKIVTLAI